MKNILCEDSLGKESIEELGFKTTDALEKELELLIRDVVEEKT